MLVEAALYVCELQKRRAEQGKPCPTITIMSDSEFALGLATGSMKLNKKSHTDLHITLGELQAIKGQYDAIFQHVDNVWVKSVLGH